MTQQPTSFLRFTLDTLANEALSFGVGAVCAAGYYAVNYKKNNPHLWRNTGIVYTTTSLAATGVRVLFTKTESA